MHYAAMNGHELCVRFLSTRGCPAKSKNSEGAIPRQVAKDEGHKAAMKDCRKAERLEGKQKVCMTLPGVTTHTDWGARLKVWT